MERHWYGRRCNEASNSMYNMEPLESVMWGNLDRYGFKIVRRFIHGAVIVPK